MQNNTNPIKPLDLSLKEFGYIAGGYMWGKCKDCEEPLNGVAKYSTRCFDCATKAKAAKESQPVPVFAAQSMLHGLDNQRDPIKPLDLPTLLDHARIHDGLDLEAIEARCNAATPGPWEILGHDGERHGLRGPRGYAEIDGWTEALPSSIEICGSADTEFIAHARQDIPALIAEIRRLRATPAPCPHISSSDEGTNSCDLAGVTGEELQNLREECQRLRAQDLAPRVRELEAALRYSARMLDPAEHDVAYVLDTIKGGPDGPAPAPALTWTREKPTESGWYLHQAPGAHFTSHSPIYMDETVTRWYDPTLKQWGNLPDGIIWCGPIPPPQPGETK